MIIVADKREMGIEELTYLERLYQNQYMLVTNAINSAMDELQELSSASKSIDSMGDIEGKESFNSIGSDFYLRSKIEKGASMIAGVGGGYLVEKNVDEAKIYVKAKMEKKNDMVNKLMKNRKELEGAIVELNTKIESLTKGYDNVRRP